MARSGRGLRKLWRGVAGDAHRALTSKNQQVKTMKNEYTAVVKKADDWWVGWIEEIPGVNCQGKTYEELKQTLEVTLKEALEFNCQDALTEVLQSSCRARYDFGASQIWLKS